MADPSLFEQFIDPVRNPAQSGVVIVVALAALVVAGGLWLIRRVLKGLGPGDGMLSSREAPVAVALAVGLVLLPGAASSLITGDKPQDEPLWFGLTQAAFAAVSIAMLALVPVSLVRDEARTPPEFHRFNARWLPRVLLVWILGYPVLQAAITASAAVLAQSSGEVAEQGLLSDLRSGDSVLWIVGWYVMAGLAAPVAEEFIFRVALFGGIRRWAQPLGRGAPWLAGAVSIGAFVIAHDVIKYPVLIVPLSCLALVLTWCYAYTRSIWPGVIIHGLHNSLVVTFQFFVVA
jgi:hypothetical protein